MIVNTAIVTVTLLRLVGVPWEVVVNRIFAHKRCCLGLVVM